MFKQIHDSLAQLLEVVRGDIGGHTNGDTRGTIQQQIGKSGRQDGRFLERAIKVINKVNGILFQVSQHFLGHGCQTGFGITHGSRRITIDGAKVTLPIDERVTHGKILGHARHGIVDGHIAVRMVLAKHLTDNARGFFV